MDHSNNDLRVKVSFRNNTLLKKREELGFSQAEMALAIGISLGAYAELECLRRSPVKKSGEEFVEAAIACAEYFEMDPKELFPESVQRISKNHSEFEMSSQKLELLLRGQNPESLMIDEEKKKRFLDFFQKCSLTDREKELLNQRFGLEDGIEKPLRIAGKIMHERNPNSGAYVMKKGVKVFLKKCPSVATFREIEAKAIRKLRNPFRASIIKDILD